MNFESVLEITGEDLPPCAGYTALATGISKQMSCGQYGLYELMTLTCLVSFSLRGSTSSRNNHLPMFQTWLPSSSYPLWVRHPRSAVPVECRDSFKLLIYCDTYFTIFNVIFSYWKRCILNPTALFGSSQKENFSCGRPSRCICNVCYAQHCAEIIFTN